MLLYSQTAGIFTRDQDIICEGCYAGRGDGKDNPDMQGVHGEGPLPQGLYIIGELERLPHLGPCRSLTPAGTNNMYGRSGFFMHLDNPAHPGESSDGCIVMPTYAALESITDTELQVIA